jgi:polyhydroxyalkanoate synthesis regulator phasin
MSMNARVSELQKLIHEIKDRQQGDKEVELVKKLEELLKTIEGNHQHQIESLEININLLKEEVSRLSRL